MQKPTANTKSTRKEYIPRMCLDELNDIRGQKFVGSAINYYSTNTKQPFKTRDITRESTFNH